MNKTNIDQALAALGDALKSVEPNTFLDNPKEFVKKIPHRSLSGDHINGGKIHNFSSSGITDKASAEMIAINDDGVVIKRFAKGFSIQDNVHLDGLTSKNVSATQITCEILNAKQIIGEVDYANDTPIVFKGDTLDGKGILWAGKGYTKQLIFAVNPDRIFISETIDLAKGKSISINNVKVLDETSLGTSITKSYLREVGRLKGLIVDGSVSINQYLFYDGNNDRLGIGTDQPKSVLNLIENNVEILIGSTDVNKGSIGTFNSQDFEIKTDNTSRINIQSNGNITLGNPSTRPVQVNVLGTLSINVNTPDSRAELHVSGPIKFNNKLHMSGSAPPQGGVFNQGDIVWNDQPNPGGHAGWICTRSGSPGLWNPFGRID